MSGTEEKRGAPAARTLPEHNHVLEAVAVAFLAGCRLAVYLEPGAWMWWVCLAGAALAFLLKKLGRRTAAGVMLCALMLGALRTQAALSPSQPKPGSYEAAGYVYGEPSLREGDRVAFTLGDVTLDGMPCAGRAYCTVYYGDEGPPELFDGAAVRFDGRVYLPDGKSGAPRSDFRMWMLQNGMSFGIASSAGLSVENTRQTAPVKDAASRARGSFQAALNGTMGDESRLAMAMLMSYREGLAQEENEAFQTLGIAHVMSVSGLHVGLMGGLLIALLNRVRLRRAWQVPVVAAFLTAYCALTGFSAASMRASVMLTLALIARVLGRRTDPFASLSAAALAVLAVKPLQAFSAGFVLSFCAVAGITLLYPVFLSAFGRAFPAGLRDGAGRGPFSRRLRNMARRRLGRPGELLCVSLAAQIGVLLPTAAYFHRLPLYGVAINLLVVPYMGLLVPVYALALATASVPWLGGWVGALASLMSRWLLAAVELLATLPYASVRVASPPAALLCALALIAAAVSRRMRAGAGRRAAAVGLLCVLGAAGAYIARPAELRYIQLSVGQADAALVMDGRSTIAIDVGEDGLAVADYLLDEGRDLDALYLTHLHADHVAGVDQLLKSGIQIKRAYLPVNGAEQRLDPEMLAVLSRLREAGVPVTELAAGDELRYNKAGVKVLWPVGESVRSGQDANDLPLVLAVDLDGYTLMSASDLTGRYETYAAIPCDVLKVAHHGSSAGTGEAFLDFAAPRLALVSCSPNNRSLPSEAVLDRLDDRGIEVLRTDLCGDITLTIRDGRLCATPYKARTDE